LLTNNVDVLLEDVEVEYDGESDDGEELCYFDDYGEELVEDDEAMYGVEISDVFMNNDGLKPAETVPEQTSQQLFMGHAF